MTRLYLSGPITGIKDMNRPAFTTAAKWLRAAGHQVVNPHDIGEPAELLLPWEEYLRADLIVMLQECEALAQLPGWESSRGALLEAHVADSLRWEVKSWDSWLHHSLIVTP